MIPAPGDNSGNRTLIAPEDPPGAILEECEQMAAKYMESPLGDPVTKGRIRELLDMAWDLKNASDPASADSPYRCCINTELNSTNFLINDRGKRSYLIDWEKPLYGDPAQDLGHFLAPTTTFWKTDVILNEEEMDSFVQEYIRRVDGRFDTSGIAERTRLFTTITCLRGITWCAMAWVEYRMPGRTLTNESTARKLDQYLGEEFLKKIRTILKKGDK
jgi:aminoglycoside phosphotransferase (APT) family kinase protein